MLPPRTRDPGASEGPLLRLLLMETVCEHPFLGGASVPTVHTASRRQTGLKDQRGLPLSEGGTEGTRRCAQRKDQPRAPKVDPGDLGEGRSTSGLEQVRAGGSVIEKGGGSQPAHIPFIKCLCIPAPSLPLRGTLGSHNKTSQWALPAVFHRN